MALLAGLGAFAISASGAAAAEEAPSEVPPVAGAEEAPSDDGAGASGVVVQMPASQMSPFSLDQCPQGHMCIWEGREWTGPFSQWLGQETGCHEHAGLPLIRSAWNRTGFTVRVGGGPELHSGDALLVQVGENPITGKVCWPV